MAYFLSCIHEGPMHRHLIAVAVVFSSMFALALADDEDGPILYERPKQLGAMLRTASMHRVRTRKKRKYWMTPR